MLPIMIQNKTMAITTVFFEKDIHQVSPFLRIKHRARKHLQSEENALIIKMEQSLHGLEKLPESP